MGSPHTSHANVQSCMQIYTHAYKHPQFVVHKIYNTLHSNPGHQLQQESQVISISLIALYHISTCSPFQHNLSSSPIKHIHTDPLITCPPDPLTPLWQTYHYICNPSMPWKQPLMAFFVSPPPKNSPQTHRHNTVFHHKNNKAVKVPLSLFVYIVSGEKLWQRAVIMIFDKGWLIECLKSYITWSPMLQGWNAHFSGIFDGIWYFGWSSLVRWSAQGWMEYRWRWRSGWVGVLMWWRGTLLSTVWNNELMELGLHNAGPLVRPTEGILA